MITRRDFVKSASLAAATPLSSLAATSDIARSAEILIQRTVRPVVISDYSGFEFKNGGTENAVTRAFRLITEGKDVLDALIAGVNIPELDPLETGIGYGALPNADGIVAARRVVHARTDEARRCGRVRSRACARRRSSPKR